MTRHYRATCETCGHTTSSKSQGLADYGLAKHNCAKRQEKNRRAKAWTDKMAQVDHSPKPCHHKRVRHQHGTHVAYVQDRCRCTACSKANSDYERNRTRQHAYGRFDQKWMPADEARTHIETLKAAGMGLRTIAKRSGVSESTLGKIIYGDPSRNMGPTKRIRHDTRDRILTVQPDLDNLADGARVGATGTRRRIEALVWVGWSINRQADLAGVDRQRLDQALSGRPVRAETARAIAALYERLWNMEPPRETHRQRISYSRAKRRARDHGWAPPMAWDRIDDPKARPIGVGTITRHRPEADLVAEVEHHLTHVDKIATAAQIAHRLGYSSRAGIQKGLKRAGRDDLLDTLRRNAELNTGSDGLHGDDRSHRKHLRKDAA